MKQHLQAKDFITIGLYSIIIFIIKSIVNAAMAPLSFVAMPYITGVGMFFSSLVYLLMAIRVGKQGPLLFMGIILGLIYTIMGAPLMLPLFALAGLLAELTLIIGDGTQYRNVTRQAIAYSIFGAIYGFGGVINIYVFGKESLEKMQFSQDTIERMLTYAYSPLWLTISICFSVVMTLIGSYVAKKILQKHFVKAGYIQYQ